MIGKLLCLIGLHRWKRLSNQWNCYGMGMEAFECWECERCPRTFNQLAREKNRHGWKSPQYGWRDRC